MAASSSIAGLERPWPYRAVLVVVVSAVFGRVLGHGFLGWDDLPNVIANPYVNPPSPEGTLHFWGHPYMDLYVPVTYTAWALLARVSLEPWVFHAASLAAHAGAALAAFALLRRLVRDDRAAAAGALLFALHPVQVEAVGWMSGLKDLLWGLFGLLALAKWVDFARAEEEGRRRVPDFLAASALYALALLSKPAAVALPLAAAVVDVAMLRRRAARVLRDLLPWVTLAVAWIALTRAVQPASNVAAPPVWERPLVAADALAFYLGKLLLPLDLVPDYGRRPAWVLEHGSPLLAALATLGPAAAILVAWRRRRASPGARVLTAGAGLFLAGVAPVLGLVAFDFQYYSTVADHYLYLSMIGPALVLAALLATRGGHATYLATGAGLAVLGAASFVQAGLWKDGTTLFPHVLRVNPGSWVAHNHMGSELAEAGHRAEALASFEAAVAIAPDDPISRYNLGTELDAQDRTEEAIVQLAAAVELSPTDVPALENLAIALLRAGREAEAERRFREALRIKPEAWLSHYYLSGILIRRGEVEEGVAHLEETIRLNPGFGPAKRDRKAVRKFLQGGRSE